MSENWSLSFRTPCSNSFAFQVSGYGKPKVDAKFRSTYVVAMSNQFTSKTILLCATFLFSPLLTSFVNAQTNFDIVEGPYFYFSVTSENGSLREIRSRVVPNVPRHVCYGWRMRLQNSAKLVQFTEEFSLPSEPDYWSNENNSYATNAISNDRKKSITKRFVLPQDGWIGNGWCVAKGDPNGTYSMKIFVSGVAIKEIDFEVVSLADYQKRSGKD